MRSLIATSMAIAVTHGAAAENVDVSTVPGRDTVQLTIYNSEDLTLVRETRRITFRPGLNPLQFSWANTLIDPSSVELRFRTHAMELDVLDTTFPHDKPQMLYWNVQSEIDGDAVVEISYFTSGITWEADYVCVADPGETQMSFEGFVKITNNSGEDYSDARVRLVVGQINLVEKVQELAQRGMVSADSLARFRETGLREKFADMAEAEYRMALGTAMRKNAAAPAPKAIIKQGLSEYFIYSIEGTETVRHRWSKRMRLFQGLEVPVRVQYRYRPAEYGEQLVRLYLLRNDQASRLGTTPLPNGIVRVLRDNGRDGLSFLATQATRYVPIGQEIEINLGVDPQVVHERVCLRRWRDNFWFSDRKAKNYFNQSEERRVRHDYPVAGWDDHARWVERIRNYRDQPIDVEIRRVYDGDITFGSQLSPSLYDYRSPQFTAHIDANTHRDLAYEITARQGINAKQSKVTLQETLR